MSEFTTKKLDNTKMVCPGCFFIYTPIDGDQESGILPGTLFAEIPETWKCPICSGEKDTFIVLTEDLLHL